MTTSRRRLLAAAAGVLVAGTLAGSGRGAFAQPLPPPPPPNPSDDQLSRSRAGVVAVDQELGALRASLATATAALEAAQIELARTLDVADRAITKRDTARAAADAAQVAATAAKDGQKVADSLVEQAQVQLDLFVGASYRQGSVAGSTSGYFGAANPKDVLDHAELLNSLATKQRDSLRALERARVGKANQDSLARASLQEASRRRDEAEARHGRRAGRL